MNAISVTDSSTLRYLGAILIVLLYLYDKMLNNCSSSRNDPVISSGNIQINLSNVFLAVLKNNILDKET